jgi:3',5'-cyclic AMP phosphodiesterase CpdA
VGADFRVGDDDLRADPAASGDPAAFGDPGGPCGVDSDGDGVDDCLEDCPTVSSLTVAGPCGCFVPETDANANGTPDCLEPAPFRVMIISDTHVCAEGGDNVTRLEALVDKINGGDYGSFELLLVTGDIADYLYEDYPDTTENCLELSASILAGLRIPGLLVPGNHEYKLSDDHNSGVAFTYEEVMERARIWSESTALPPYYSVNYRGWRFIVLDDIRGRYQGAYFDTEQLDWLETQLADQVPTTLYFHIPMQTDSLLTYWCSPDNLMTAEAEPRFYAMLEAHRSHVRAIFVGHGHVWSNDTLYGDIEVREATGFGKGLIVLPGTYPHFAVSFEPDGTLTVGSGL